MKKISITLLLILSLILIFPLTVQADTGPKPSVVIDFKGLNGKTYYATLLSNVKSTGPFSALGTNKGTYEHYKEGDKDYDIFQKFVKYQAEEGYYFLQHFQNCTSTHQFSWTYYPPQEFKILLYFPETDSFIISEDNYQRYAFDSYFTAKISVDNILVEKSYDYNNEIISLFIRIILTLAIELCIALMFGLRKKNQFLFIMVVNIITQVGLNIALNIINYDFGYMGFIIFYILMEIIVFIAEAYLYTWYFKKNGYQKVSFLKVVMYALTANVASFVLGMALTYWLPGIF